MQAPLGRGAAARLSSEVSRAGGLGTLGASWTEPAVLREQLRSIARVTDRPFCVNLVLDFAQDERLEVVVEERVPWVSFSFGLRPALVTRARAGGARVLVQVASADAARAAATAGADALIVQGVEAGGHVQSVVGLLPLLAEVRRAVSLPLLAAGGIADPASARAALTAGASAVVMGTRFVASDECDAHPRYKSRLLAAEGRDTVLTGLFDVGWPAPHRVLQTAPTSAGRRPVARLLGSAQAKARLWPRAYRAMRSTSRSRAPTVTSRRWRCTPARASGRSTPLSRRQRSWSVSLPRCDRPRASRPSAARLSGSGTADESRAGRRALAGRAPQSPRAPAASLGPALALA